METKRLRIFLLLAFGLTWAIFAAVTLAGVEYGSAASSLVLSCCMLMPAIASLLTRAFTKEGFKRMGFALGFSGGGWKSYLAAYFAPAVCMVLGAAAFFLLFPHRYDASFAVMRDAYAAAGVPAEQISLVAVINLIVSFVIGPVINVPFTLGEELGWRAYLLPKLAGRFGQRKAILVSGLIWGLWHGPMIAAGHNYGRGYPGWPYLGIVAMAIFCIALGSFAGYLYFRTKSVWPPAILHSGINALAATPLYFTVGEADPFVGPVMTGCIGGWALLALGLICYFKCEREGAALEPEGNV